MFPQKTSVRRRRLWLRFWVAVTTLAVALFILGFLSTVVLFLYFSKDLPNPGRLRSLDIAESTKIYDRNGELLYDIYGEQNREQVNLSEIPKHVKDATIAIEDKDFYRHKGFAVGGWARSLVTIATKRRLEGGSTLTQQLVKNSLLSPERTFKRKLKEFILALQVEHRYSKDEILEMYLNMVSYGGQSWGIQTAARTYFGKNIKDVSVAEAAILAGLPQKPTAYSPFGANPKAYKARSFDVLRRMREEGFITEAEFQQARKEIEEEKIQFAEPGINIKAPHFTIYVRDLLIERYGAQLVEQGGLRVTTTLDYELQKKAQQILADELNKLKGAKVSNGAVVVMDAKTGQLLAMVGSKNYFDKDIDGQVNVALALRQPGSAMKPVTYATGFKKGYTPATLFLDIKTEFDDGPGKPKYVPVNYDGKFHGPAQLRFALGNSYNIPAVKMLGLAGIKDVMQTAYDMGIGTWEPTSENLRNVGLSLTLGGREVRLLDLVTAYSVVAAGGVRRDPVLVLKVTDSTGRKVYEEWKPLSGKRALSEEISYLISHILSDNGARSTAFGTGSLLNIPGKTVAVKTGTTDEKRDNWTIGYTPSVVVGVWVGNNNNEPMSPQITSGVTGAAPIWNALFKAILKDKKDEPFVKPATIVSAEIDAVSGLKPGPYTDKRRFEYFVKGTEPTKEDDMHRKVKICKDGSLATPACEASGEVEERVYTILSDEFVKNVCESCPPSDGKEEYASLAEQASGIRIINVADGANVPLSFDLLAKPTGGVTLAKVNFLLDGTIVKTTSTEPFSHRYTFSPAAAGTHTLTVEGEDTTGNKVESTIKVRVMTDL